MTREEYDAQYYRANKDKILARKRESYLANRERAIAAAKKHYRDNRDEILESRKKYYQANKETIDERKRRYIQANRTVVNARQRKYVRKQYRDNNLTFLIPTRLRHRLNKAIKNNYKAGSAVKDLGCSIEEFQLKFESLFTDGMTWGNWGTVWHLDHIIPLSFFNLEDETEFKVAVHYTNLQPLQVTDNLKKKDTLPT